MNIRLTALVVLLVAASIGFAQDVVRKIQATDKVKVTCTEESLLSKTYTVSKDGVVLMDFLGAVEIEGMTAAQAADAISRKLVDERILKKATVAVEIVGAPVARPSDDQGKPPVEEPVPAQTQSQVKPVEPVRYRGAVKSGGEIGFKDGLKLSDVVKSASVLDTADMGCIVVKSTDGSEKKVDASKAEADLALKPGDEVVFVEKPAPVAAEVYVIGGVAKPGSVTLSDTLTVKKAIEAAGGFSDTAVKKRVRVERDGESVETLDFTVPGTDMALKPHDRVIVEMATKRAYVRVTGAVKSPGYFVAPPGMKLGDAINAAGGLSVRAKIEKVKVTPADGSKPYFVNYQQIQQGYAGDVALNAGDGVYIAGNERRGISATHLAIGILLFLLIFG